MTKPEIMSYLPYRKPFLFVDELDKVDDTGVTGHYTFCEDAFFYEGHFKGYPITPGVILTECMAQIGVVCLGLHLLDTIAEGMVPLGVFINSQISYKLPVLPGERVTVVSKKLVYRFDMLKCEVVMYTSTGAEACHGTITGMVKLHQQEEFDRLMHATQVKA